MLNGDITFKDFDLLVVDIYFFFSASVEIITSRVNWLEALYKRFDLVLWEDVRLMSYFKNKKKKRLLLLKRMDYVSYIRVNKTDVKSYLRLNNALMLTTRDEIREDLGRLAFTTLSSDILYGVYDEKRRAYEL